ncbi:hypothetical protein ACFVYC_13600 [Pseudarthrobacter sp. NPDC058329]|uniref:hypothetical protein n=1 Tax=Pseudarthrobacter sp. NPDC058329 TaxID=3346448 RepID=UPI0036D7A4BE
MPQESSRRDTPKSGREFKVVFADVLLTEEQAVVIQRNIEAAVLQSLSELDITDIAMDDLDEVARQESLSPQALDRQRLLQTDGLIARDLSL